MRSFVHVVQNLSDKNRLDWPGLAKDGAFACTFRATKARKCSEMILLPEWLHGTLALQVIPQC